MFIWVCVTTVLAVLVLYFRQVYSRFSKYGVKNFQPLPILGTMGRLMFRIEHAAEYMERTFTSFPEERFVGSFEFLTPVVMLRDLELVKKITVKDFEHFLDHRMFFDSEPLIGRSLISLKGQEWKDMRSTLSPAFTSSKIRMMVPFMVEVGDQMIKTLKNKIKATSGVYVDVDAKDLSSRYANDVIATCAFGLKVDSHTDEKNEFYAMGKEATSFTLMQMLALLLGACLPGFLRKGNFGIFSNKVRKFLNRTILHTMKEREAHNIIRPDMIHLLMEAKKGQLSHEDKTTTDPDAGFATVEESAVGKKVVQRSWTDNDLVAQAVLFLFAGFDTVSSAMTFMLYELAVNPDVQEKLRQEIRETDAKNNGKFDFNSIQQMTYMDMVVSEVLRLWPPAPAMDRYCVKDYNMGKPNNQATKDYIIRKGEGLQIPVYGFHRNPEYFPNPSKFDPERFSDENKHNIKPFTYMPFGLGPRNCIGSRFALCEVKVMAYQLLKDMELSPSHKTPIPAALARNEVGMRLKGGHWIRMKALS